MSQAVRSVLENALQMYVQWSDEQKNLMTAGEDTSHEVRPRFTGTKELL